MSRANFGSYKINLIVMLITIKTLREKDIISVKLAIATNLRQKSWHAFPLLQYLSHKFITFSLPTPPPPNSLLSVYRDEVVIARLQHYRGEGGSRF